MLKKITSACVRARTLHKPATMKEKSEVEKAVMQSQVEQTLSAVRRASESLLLLDYDGTLAPFHEQREQAFPYPGIAALVQQIAHTGRTRVQVVSGRTRGVGPARFTAAKA